MKLDIKINFKNGYDAITDKDTRAEKERNDCVVRALMNAFEISYNAAHKVAERDFNRVRRQGTQGTYLTLLKMVDGELTAPNSKQVEYLGSHPKAGGRKTLLNPLYPTWTRNLVKDHIFFTISPVLVSVTFRLDILMNMVLIGNG